MSSWIFILESVDERILRALALRRGRVLDRIMREISALGGPLVTVGLALILLSGWLSVSRMTALEVVFTLAVSHLLVQVVKRMISRPRPVQPVRTKPLIEAPDRFSFPSGHATAALSVVLPLAVVVPIPVAVGLLALGILVGVSRCYLGLHYPGDVLMGWFLASVTAVLADWAIPRLLVRVTVLGGDWIAPWLLPGIL